MVKILVISPTPTHPQNAGNRARVFSLLSELQRAGHEIHFLYLERAGMEGDNAAMERQWDSFWKIPFRQPSTPWRKRWYDSFSKTLGKNRVLPYKIDDWFDDRINSSVCQISARLNPDIILVEYVFISKVLQFFGKGVLKILDTHDVFGGRDKLFIQNNLPPQWFYVSEVEEKKGIERADVILAIQPQEAAYFRKLSRKTVLTIGHLITPVASGNDPPAYPPKLLFVGSSNHANLDGIKWFLNQVFGILREKFPRIELDLVGNACDFIDPVPGLNLVGIVNELTPFYEKASVVINPLQFGTGLKIKTVEALAMKRPLVTTPIGAAGIEEWTDRAFLCAEEPDEFAAAILQVFTSKELQDRLIQGAEEFTNLYNKTAFKPLKKEIDAFLHAKGVAPNPCCKKTPISVTSKQGISR